MLPETPLTLKSFRKERWAIADVSPVTQRGAALHQEAALDRILSTPA